MYEQRLTERLRSQELEPMRRGKQSRKRCIDSVVAHLQCILNTRQGNVPLAEDYGAPDFVGYLQDFPDSIKQIEESICSAIRKYEPRLAGAKVTFVPREDDDLALRFQIVGCLAIEGEGQVLLETTVSSDGRISVFP